MHALLHSSLEFGESFLTSLACTAVKYSIGVFLRFCFGFLVGLFFCLSCFLRILDAFFMVSITIHSLILRIFIDFPISHQFGRLISHHPCGFGEQCWLYSVAIFQGRKMMEHSFEGRTLSVYILTGYISCLHFCLCYPTYSRQDYNFW